jgi:hypothetical protein
MTVGKITETINGLEAGKDKFISASQHRATKMYRGSCGRSPVVLKFSTRLSKTRSFKLHTPPFYGEIAPCMN